MAERQIWMPIFPRLTQLDMTGPYESAGRPPEHKGASGRAYHGAGEDRSRHDDRAHDYFCGLPQLDLVMVPAGRPARPDGRHRCAGIFAAQGVSLRSMLRRFARGRWCWAWPGCSRASARRVIGPRSSFSPCSAQRPVSVAEVLSPARRFVKNALAAAIRRGSAMEGLPVYFPSRPLSTDNAAMIAAAAYPKFLAGDFADERFFRRSRYEAVDRSHPQIFGKQFPVLGFEFSGVIRLQLYSRLAFPGLPQAPFLAGPRCRCPCKWRNWRGVPGQRTRYSSLPR